MNDDIQYLSREKYETLEKEQKELKSDKIPEIANRIDEARQMGDLSENAEYHAARDEMAWVQTRVKEINRILNTSEVIDGARDHSSSVTIGSTVTVKSEKIEREFTIVGAQEADPLAGRISNESPLGRAFLGGNKGDKVEVEAPAGVQIYKILNIE